MSSLYSVVCGSNNYDTCMISLLIHSNIFSQFFVSCRACVIHHGLNSYDYYL